MVVGGGRTCLEALSLGRRAVVARAVVDGNGEVSAPAIRAAGQLGAPVTPATLDMHVADNFRWSGRPPVPAAEAWRVLESMSTEDVTRLRGRVHADHSADTMLDRELALLDDLRRRPDDSGQLLVAAGEYAADLGTALLRGPRQPVAA